MKRRNVQQAFIGEPDPNQEGLAAQGEGDDAIETAVRDGRIVVTVPAATPDDEVFEHQGYLSGELTLEDGRTLTFEIQAGAEGAPKVRSGTCWPTRRSSRLASPLTRGWA